FSRGIVFDHAENGALGLWQSQALALFVGDWWRLDLYAETRAMHLPLTQLGQERLDRVDRYGEADADVALAAFSGEDRAVDADHSAVYVDQRTAGIAWIDRGIDLQHVLEAAFRDGERTRLVAHDTNRHGVTEPERISDGNHPIARLQRIRIAKFGGR